MKTKRLANEDIKFKLQAELYESIAACEPELKIIISKFSMDFFRFF